MKNSAKIMQIKNLVLLGTAAVYYIFFVVFGIPLVSDHVTGVSLPKPASDVNVYFQANLAFVIFFLIFVSISLTSFLLGYLIYHKFDRNRAASQTAVRTGMFFLCAAVYVITGTNALDVFYTYATTFDYLSVMCQLFLPLMYVSYVTAVFGKTRFFVVDWIFTTAFLAVTAASLLNLSERVIHIILSVYNIGTLTMMFCMALERTCNIIRLKKYADLAHIVSGVLEMAFLAAAGVMLVLRKTQGYWLCFSAALVLLAFWVFGELVNMAARRYINTADAENYRKMAYIDALCNISNRNAFLLEQSETFDSDSLFYVVFDVNNLKRINDRFGHAEGDRIIKKAAELIRENFDEIGKCYRIGGDEFAVIGQYGTAEEISEVIERMKAEAAEFNKDSEAKLDLAFGYAIRSTADVNTYELFNKADKAMYRNKRVTKCGLATV